jgi:hypothetical protein
MLRKLPKLGAAMSMLDTESPDVVIDPSTTVDAAAGATEIAPKNNAAYKYRADFLTKNAPAN